MKRRYGFATLRDGRETVAECFATDHTTALTMLGRLVAATGDDGYRLVELGPPIELSRSTLTLLRDLAKEERRPESAVIEEALRAYAVGARPRRCHMPPWTATVGEDPERSTGRWTTAVGDGKL